MDKQYEVKSQKPIRKLSGAAKEAVIKLAGEKGISYNKEKDYLFTNVKWDIEKLYEKLSPEAKKAQGEKYLLAHILMGETRRWIEGEAGLIEKKGLSPEDKAILEGVRNCKDEKKKAEAMKLLGLS